MIEKKKTSGNAPDFSPGAEWLNTNKPISLKELKGKFVLLDFWTYCCINCMHIIPDLKKLEEKYKNELVVIGVHSAKFLAEKSTDNIRDAILRYDIEHPVINDKDFKVWQSYVVRAWPTVILIDPNNDIVGYLSGEGIFAPIDSKLQELIPKYDWLDRTPIKFELEKEKRKETLLHFPGKVLAAGDENRVYITDSNNNRILIADLQGNLIDVIGSGKKGRGDGGFDECEFFAPQGSIRYKQYLIIADNENHLIRKADLQSRTVTTIAGIGKQIYERNPEGKGTLTGLNSPWDLSVIGNTLFIAMAGPHQIWALDLETNNVRLHAGSGSENIVDGKLKSAALAQPSGITTDGTKLYFADSEVSAIRMADVDEKGNVETIIGEGLFEFGDIDGSYPTARLQHPLGVVYVEGKLYVADTYNNKIKVIDPLKKTVTTLAGTGKRGSNDGIFKDASFNHPAGISYANGLLFIADTDNHLIRILDLKSEKVTTLILRNLSILNKNSKSKTIEIPAVVNEELSVNLSKLKEINLQVKLPSGFKLNKEAESYIRIISPTGEVISEKRIENFELNIVPEKIADLSLLYVEIIVYYCKNEAEGVCMLSNKVYKLVAGRGESNFLKLTVE